MLSWPYSSTDSKALLDPSEIVGLLITHGADVNAIDEGAWSALHGAASHGLDHVAKILLQYGADVRVRSVLGSTPLHIAAKRGAKSTNVAVMLVAHGADLNVRDAEGKTPLEIANTAMQKAILKARSSIQSKDQPM